MITQDNGTKSIEIGITNSINNNRLATQHETFHNKLRLCQAIDRNPQSETHSRN